MTGFNTWYMMRIENSFNEKIANMYKYVNKRVVANVSATMYYPVSAQCDKDPLITACMYKINPKKASSHKWIAMSRNLLKRWNGKFSYGDRVKITGCGKKDGIYTVADTMNKRFVNKIDFLETAGTHFYKFDNVTIEKV